MQEVVIKKQHPSPDKFRTKWLSLNGEWEFSFDEPIFDKTINLPFSWTCPLSGINEPDRKGTAYYRRKISYDCGKNRLFIIFGGVDYSCKVWINGVQTAMHEGGYCRFEIDITELWNGVENEIIVEATDFDCDDQMYGKQGYGNIRGIWQDVYLEERPQNYIKSFRISTAINGNVEIKTDIAGKFDKLSAEIDGSVYETGSNVLHLNIENPNLWSPETPYLYDCKLQLYSGEEIDEVNTYFGIREIGMGKFDGNTYITLNRKPVYINAALDQSFNTKGFFTLPNDNYAEEEIRSAKALGLNAIRIHIKAEEKTKLYWADKLGIMIIQDIPCFWGNPTQKAKERFEKQMYKIIERDINHPSIISWVIFNETWGLKTFNDSETNDWIYEKSTQEWVRTLYRDLKKYDPTRLIEDNSPCNRDHVETDINSWHFYINGYENIKKEFDRVSEQFACGSGENFTEGNTMSDVPVMNSECGNYWGIKGNAGDSDISWHYKYMMNGYRLHDRLCGFVFTEFKDVINEFNGYYRIDGSRKYFGYDYFVPEMTVCDLHSADYLGYDYTPMTEQKCGSKVNIPLFVSSFTDKNHGKNMSVKWEVITDNAIEPRKITDCGYINISYTKYGKTDLQNLSISMPDYDAIVITALYLTDEKGETVMRNFLLFNCTNGEENQTVSFEQINYIGFKKVIPVQQGHKINCIGSGELSFEIDKKDFNNKPIELIFEASSKQELTKDKDGEKNKISDMELFFGYSIDRGANRNSFYMTDDELFGSSIEIYVGNIKINEYELPDDPADSRGCLSWLYQKTDDLLDEAGSYGYLVRTAINRDILDKLPEVFGIKIKVNDGGISLYDSKSGRYPIGMRIIQ